MQDSQSPQPSAPRRHELALDPSGCVCNLRTSENDYNARTWQIERSTPRSLIQAQMKRLGLA